MGFMQKPAAKPIYLRQWRKHRDMSQERFADLMEVDRTVISKIENGKVSYTQGFLEAAAYALRCQPADLLMRDPSQPDAIWTIWEQIPETERARAVAVLKAFMSNAKTGT